MLWFVESSLSPGTWGSLFQNCVVLLGSVESSMQRMLVDRSIFNW